MTAAAQPTPTPTAPDTLEAKKMIDELGQLKAKMADLEKREKEIKETLLTFGKGTYDGFLFKATVIVGERKVLDQTALKSYVSQAIIDQCTKVHPMEQVRVLSR